MQQILRSIPIRYHHCSGMLGFFWFYQHHGDPKPLRSLLLWLATHFSCFILSAELVMVLEIVETRQDLGHTWLRGLNFDGLYLEFLYCETSKCTVSPPSVLVRIYYNPHFMLYNQMLLDFYF